MKTFLDPTVMIHGADYEFAANLLPLDAELYTHRLGLFWAINHRTGVWADVPVLRLSGPDQAGDSGLGDAVLGWGVITHENLLHIFPKGVFVSVVPSFVFNLNQDFNFFSLGVGVGRAFTRSVAVSGGYAHHVAGRETFNQVFSFQLSFVFGRRRDAS